MKPGSPGLHEFALVTYVPCKNQAWLKLKSFHPWVKLVQFQMLNSLQRLEIDKECSYHAEAQLERAVLTL